MKLFYCPDYRSKRCMEVEVPDDIGPCIDLGANGPSGSMVVHIDKALRIYDCEDGIRWPIPERYFEVDENGDSCNVVARPGGARYRFAWPKKAS